MPDRAPQTGRQGDRVVAVVVAYNRRDLLREALDALAQQTRKLDAVVVVDNRSDDDSAVVAAEHPVGAEVLSLVRNTGGAGGFAVGLAHAVEKQGADLVWLMDDDTIPTPEALAELLRAREAYPGPVALLGSKVVWHDGREHPMNTPRRRPGASAELIARAASAGAVPVRSSSFVSMLVDARAVRHHGLPVADYFIWNDDFEYSCRLLRRSTGLHVPASVVVHRTKTFGATDVDPGERFYYEVRNKIWMLTRSSALSPFERVLYTGASIRRWARTYARSARRDVLRSAGLRGLRDGILQSPRTTTDVLQGAGPLTGIEALETARRPSA
ncbi:glycosyltransferase family 2 protein [Antribacter sp. KLBMP9083]|uniref:Glycosyltransferase family 2 protein n=1 Tax=Antribacter soli TaxID=2910976 RepID=A0AA41U845_9MICO|nr:glycosyltransferase family 2 protein [Antribacter soli]MCF4120107.1 glycosyltransferase family 2 protein [Antribacter soli]